MAVRLFVTAALLTSGSAAVAAPLTIRTGETWLFAVKDGQPVGARKAAATAVPPRGQFAITVRAALGTTMFVTNATGNGYAFRAQLIRGGKAEAARTCTIPPTGKPVLESWMQKAEAVRIADFKISTDAGHCP